MLEFFLYAGVPIVIGIAFLLVVFIVFVVRTKKPKFDQWMNEVWPNKTQRSAITTVVVIVFFLWLVIGKPW
ncbi:heme/copper-type cytochrome/quinol oxidase subunit 2 [Bradyrhizobium japonicum]